MWLHEMAEIQAMLLEFASFCAVSDTVVFSIHGMVVLLASPTIGHTTATPSTKMNDLIGFSALNAKNTFIDSS